MITQAFILAAGLGTRMRPITDTLPKPMIEVGGKSLITMIIDHLVAYGIKKIVINTFYKAELLEEHVLAYFKKINFDNFVIIREESLLETGGGIVNALSYLDDAPFFVVNGDGMWTGENPFNALNKAWFDDMKALFLLVSGRDAKGHDGNGDFDLDADNNIYVPASQPPYIYASVHITKPQNFSGAVVEKRRMMDIYSQKFKTASTYYGIQGLVFEGTWFHISTPASIKEAEGFI